MAASSRREVAVMRRTGSPVAKTVTTSPVSGWASVVVGRVSTKATSQSAQSEKPSRDSDPQLDQNIPSPFPRYGVRRLVMTMMSSIAERLSQPIDPPHLDRPRRRPAEEADGAGQGGEALVLRQPLPVAIVDLLRD